MREEQLKFFSAGDDASPRLKRRKISIPLDTFILSGVVVFLLFILAYSLGVEKGRKISLSAGDTFELLEKDAPAQNLSLAGQGMSVSRAEKAQEAITNPVPINTETKKTEPQRPAQGTSAKTELFSSASSSKEPYYIQIATYNKESFAIEEAKRLKDKGFPSFTAKKGNFVVLYVGTFKTLSEAQRNLGLLKKSYKDCILRTR